MAKIRALVLSLILLLISVAPSYADVVFEQNFDGYWSRSQPPEGWLIYSLNGGSPPPDGIWHRRTGDPWPENPTPAYACVMGAHPANPHDSGWVWIHLRSPYIPRSLPGVTLECSTYFEIRPGKFPYVYIALAETLWPLLTKPIREYDHNNYRGPEHLDLSRKADSLGFTQAYQVIWEVNLRANEFYWWAIDDVKVTAASAVEEQPLQRPEYRLSIYPNPCRQALHIITPSTTVRIYNGLGRLVKTMRNSNGIWKTGRAPPGIYFVRAGSEGAKVILE